jgi:hypothetical protein
MFALNVVRAETRVWVKMASLKFISAGMLLCAFQAPGLEAIPSYSGGGTFGYVTGGAGFAFSPQLEISITALGGVPMDQPQDAMVTLWDHNGQPLVSALITSNSVLSNWARYEAISPVTAFAGQTYYVSSVETNSGLWEGHVLWGSGVNSNGTFTVGPGLSYTGAGLGTNSNGTFPRQFYPTNYLLIGPNFMYVTNTTLIISGLQIISGQAQISFSVSGVPATSFTLLESDQPSAPWATNLAALLATNVPGASYTFNATPTGPVRFYRIQTP